MIYQCPRRCGFATDDPDWLESHQERYGHQAERPHDVSGLTAGELERTRRELQANLGLIRPGSPARVPILAHLSAIDAALAQAPRSP
jgi:hypothetical protein